MIEIDHGLKAVHIFILGVSDHTVLLFYLRRIRSNLKKCSDKSCRISKDLFIGTMSLTLCRQGQVKVSSIFFFLMEHLIFYYMFFIICFIIYESFLKHYN